MDTLTLDIWSDAPETQGQEERVDSPVQDDEEEERDTYIGYKPSKVREGRSHPDPIVETQALGAVVPPDPHYQHDLKALLDDGRISDAQLETIIYACMRFEQRLEEEEDDDDEGGPSAAAACGSDAGAPAQLQPRPPQPRPRPRAGFFLGDGAGVGKGRQIGALIRECWKRDVRRVLWVSVSTDLREDAGRDLKDTGCLDLGIKLHPQGKNGAMPAAHDSLERHFSEGVLFVTYSLLIGKGAGVTSGRAALKKQREQDGERSRTRMEKEFRRNPLKFYPPGSRVRQIVDWLQAAGEGNGECLIVLDECHRAKNLLLGEGTQTGRAVEALQLALPNARVLYSSATGATEPQNLAYMLRLGHKGFESMRDLSTSLQAAGLGALELFASGMKALGTYVGRTLSYSGAEFMVEQADIEPEYRVMYDRAAEFWQLLFKVTENLPKFGDKRDTMRASMFWSSHQRFFRLMLIACKVNRCAQLALEAVQRGHAVVIGLQSTGEANMDQVRTVEGDELDDFISSPQVQIRNFVLNFFPTCHPANIEIDTMALDRLVFQVKMALDAWGVVTPAAEEVRKNPMYWGADTAVRVAKGRAAAAAAAANRAAASPPAATAAAGATPLARAGAEGTAPAAATPAPRRKVAFAGAAGPTAAAGAAAAVAAAVDDDDILEMIEVPTSASTVATPAVRSRRPLGERQPSAVKAEPASTARKAAAAALCTGKPGSLPGPTPREVERDAPATGARGRVAGRASPTDASATAADPIVIDSDSEDEEGRRSGPGTAAAAPAGDRVTSGPAAGAGAGAAAVGVDKGAAGTGGDDDEEEEDEGVLEGVEVSLEEMLQQRREAAMRRGDLIDLGSSADDEAVRQLVAELAREQRREQDAERESALGRARAELAAREQELKAARRRLQLLEIGEVDPEGLGPEDGQPAAKRHCSRPEAAGGGCAACGSGSGGGSARVNPLLSCCEGGCRTRLHLLCWDPVAEERPLGDWLCPECVARRSQKRLAGASEFKRHNTLIRSRSDVAAAEAAVEAAASAVKELSLSAHGGGQVGGQRGGAGSGAGGSDGGAGAGGAGNGAAGSGRSGSSREEAIELEDDDFSLDAVLAAASTPAVARVKKEAGAGAAASAPKRRGRPPKRIKEEAAAGAGGVGGVGGGSGMGAARTPCGNAAGGAPGVSAPPSSYAVKSRSLPLGVTPGMVEAGGDPHAEEDAEDAMVPVPQLAAVRKMLLEFVGRAVELPPTPLDRLVQLLGGSEQVAEMTGRKGRLEEDPDGKVRYHDRSQQLGEARKRVNLTERKAFMDGKKDIAIISDAASTGVSLHANRNAPNQKRRFHITLELPWSADKAIQQFGRSHRANQASAPIYCLLVSKCGGEYRFAGSVARRLQSLGALLQGDRNALGATKDLKAFDVTSPWGKAAVHQLYFECKHPEEAAMQGVITPLLPDYLRGGAPLASAQAAAVTAAAAAAAGGGAAAADVPEPQRRAWFMPYVKACLTNVGLAGTIQKVKPRNPTLVDHSAAGEKRVESFLNRLLGLPLADQQRVFDYYWQLMGAIIAHAKSTGIYDYGIQGLEGRSLAVRRLTTVHTEPGSNAKAFYAEVEADRGVPWEEALAAYREAVRLCDPRRPDHRIGFYVEKSTRSYGGTGRPLVLLATPCAAERITRRVITWFRVRRPNGAGRRGAKLVDESLTGSYTKIPLQHAQQLWDFWYQFLRTHCMHGHNCTRRQQGGHCSLGQSIRTHHVISGAVIPIWRQLAEVIAGVRHIRTGELEEEEMDKENSPRGRRRVQDADEDPHEPTNEDEGGGGRGRSRAGGVRNAKRWPACVRVLAGVSPQVAVRAQEAGMRLVPQEQAAAGALVPITAAAAAAAAGPSNGAAPGLQGHQLLFVGLDLKYGQVRNLMARLEEERAQAAQQVATGARAAAARAPGTGAAAARGGAYG